MTVDSNNAIVVATLLIVNWLKNLAPVLQPMRKTKAKPITPCTRDFSRPLSKLHVTAMNSDWFIALFVPVVIGQSNYFGIGFSTVI